MFHGAGASNITSVFFTGWTKATLRACNDMLPSGQHIVAIQDQNVAAMDVRMRGVQSGMLATIFFSYELCGK